MNILEIDYGKIYNKFWYQAYYKGNKIIFLMSQETLDLFKQTSSIHFTDKDKYQQLFFCNIAIANWLPYGDVRMVKEC